ncbi:MAG: hypothetical protein WBE53_24310, partial [Pseudolabrys sp.]
FGNSFWIKLRGHSDRASAFWQEYRLRQGHYEAPNQPDRLQQSSFITVSALSPHFGNRFLNIGFGRAEVFAPLSD